MASHTPLKLHSDRDDRPSREGGALVVAIGAFKLATAVLLFALAVLAALAARRGVPNELTPWIEALHIDPGNRVFRAVVGRLSTSLAQHPARYPIGSAFYATVFLVEGVGLLARKRWAEWLTVVVTASFIPLEGVALARHFSTARVAAIVVDFGIVAYLLVRRLSARRDGGRRRGEKRVRGS